MEFLNKSPFNSQEPFPIGETPLIPEFDLNSANLLNPQALSSPSQEPALPGLPDSFNNNPQDTTISSQSINFSPNLKDLTFTTPVKKSLELDTLTGDPVNERQIDYFGKDAVFAERRASQIAPIAANPKKPPLIQSAEVKFKDANGQPFENNKPVLFLTGSNVLADNFGDPKGSEFSDLVVKFYVGSQTYEGTILTNLSRELENNQFEVAVRVPDTLPLGGSRIVLGRKQNEKVTPNPAEPAQEILYNSNSYRIENDTEYVFAAQWTADRIAVLNGSDPESVVATTNSSDLLIGNIGVGTDDRLDRARDLTVTSDGSRVYVPLEASGRVALVDPITRQQIDTKADIAGINPIDLPSGAAPRSIVIDSRDQYAYIADGKAGGNSIYILDINPSSSNYHQVTQTVTVGAAPSGLRQMAISSDGKKLFVTAPNGLSSRIYVVNIDPKDRPRDPSQNPKRWNQLIGTVTADEGVEGLASTIDPLKMTFTNSGKDSKGFGVLDITNNDPVSFAATTRYTNLGLGSELDYFDLNEGVSVTVLPDASYAFVVGRNNDTRFFGREIPSVDGDPRAGSNIGIIQDPLTNPQLVAATRPIPSGLATDLVLSSDSKYLYASYPHLTGGANGKMYVFDIEEFVNTVTNPGQFQIDARGRGVGLPLFDSTTARTATVADLSRVPIDNINPAVSIAADFQILTDANNQYTYGVPPGSKRAPVAATNSRGLAATPQDWLDLLGPGENTNDLTPTFDWNFSIPDSQIREVNLFVSTFPEGEGLLPWDQVVNLSEVLPNSNLNEQQKRELLSSPWQGFDDFNPNRILTATWKPAGGWVWNGGDRLVADNDNFTLDPNLTLTSGQTYYWAVEAINAEGERNLDFGEFNTQLESSFYPFRSVTVLTHGFTPPIVAEAVIPPNFFDIANNIADSGGGGLILRYDKGTGFWVPVDKYGVVMPDFPAGQNPATTTNYLEQLATYISDNYSDKSLVLLPDWAQNNESSVPDSGFTEGAADAFYASLVQLDQALGGTIGELDPQGGPRFYDSQGKLIRQQGDLFDSPMHFIGFSRGTVVNSEIVQRLLTAFPNAGGTTQFDQDFHVTTIDPHDFDQESLELPVIGGFRNFYEPKVQTWEGITFADNYYQTTAAPGLLSFTPNGRNIPNLLPPEDTSNQPGLQFPKDANDNLLGVPDVVEFLGTRSQESGYFDSRPGFTRQTDAIPLIGGGFGANHGRVLNWYSGSANLGLTESQPSYAVDWLNDPVYRRRSDGAYEVLFDRDLYDTNPNRVNPWYTPNHTDANFVQGSAEAPWEGIGTGWFYSINGGGERLRPETQPRVPLSFDNTYSARMRGDAAVPTLFNGNFDAVTDPFGGNLSQVRRTISNALPGWSFHNGQSDSNIDLVQNLEDVKSIKGKSETDYAFKLGANGVQEIVHNRFIVPDWGNLRFDVHAPVRSGNLKVTLETTAGTPLAETTIDLGSNLETLPFTDGEDVYFRPKMDLATNIYLGNANKIGFGEVGFETFQLNLQTPDEVTQLYRGQPATLKFELEGGDHVFLDNVFFKSEHLRFGNPTEAIFDSKNPDQNQFQTNLLLEKPQFASSYNAVTGLPNWVSWKVDSSWRKEREPRLTTPFITDPDLPGSSEDPSWPRINGIMYIGTGLDRGHLIPNQDRNRNEKDAQATYLSTNLIPQAIDNNRLFRNTAGRRDPRISPVWAKIESLLVTQLIFDQNKELYITAGVFDTGINNWSIQPKTRAPEELSQPGNGGNTNPTNLINNEIRIPGWTWKTILVLDKPGLAAEDVLGSYTYITPNIPEPSTNWEQPIEHPLNQLLGLNLPPITSAAEWRTPPTWKISIEQLETLLNSQGGTDLRFNFLSSLPQDVRNRIKQQGDFPFPPPSP
jgi:DNA/RNA endonuclease G (NUC1)